MLLGNDAEKVGENVKYPLKHIIMIDTFPGQHASFVITYR